MTSALIIGIRTNSNVTLLLKFYVKYGQSSTIYVQISIARYELHVTPRFRLRGFHAPARTELHVSPRLSLRNAHGAA